MSNWKAKSLKVLIEVLTGTVVLVGVTILALGLKWLTVVASPLDDSLLLRISTVVVSVILFLAPKILTPWKTYWILWHRVRWALIFVALVILLPLSLLRRWAPALGGLWLVLSLIAGGAIYYALEVHRTAPVAHGLLVDTASFLNDQPLEAAASRQLAAALVARFDTLAVTGTRQLPNLSASLRSLRALYGLPSPVSISAVEPAPVASGNVGRALQELPAAPNAPDRIDSSLPVLLRVRLLLLQSRQGNRMGPVLEALEILETWQPQFAGAGSRHVAGGITHITADLWRNSHAVASLLAARPGNYNEYEAWSRGRGSVSLPPSELIVRADQMFRSSARESISILSAGRALNNRLELELDRLGSAAAEPLDWTNSETEIAALTLVGLVSYEERVARSVEPLLQSLKTAPNPVFMLTLARAELTLANISALQAEKAGTAEPKVEVIGQHLDQANGYIRMALLAGFESQRLQEAGHNLGLCHLLSYSILRRPFRQRAIDALYGQAESRAHASIRTLGAAFECGYCRRRFNAAGTLNDGPSGFGEESP